MGECPFFRMRVSRTGTVEYHGLANVDIVGERIGRVNFHQFDALASLVETSGFLDLSEKDDGVWSSTIGKIQIGVDLVGGRQYLFTRDAMNVVPLFSAVEEQMRNLLEGVTWEDEKYDGAKGGLAAHGRGTEPIAE